MFLNNRLRLLVCYFVGVFFFSSVQFFDVRAADIDDTNNLVPAVLIAKQKATFSSTMQGKIVQLDFQEGDVFAKGDVLYGFDCAEIDASIREKQASKDSALVAYTANKKLKNLNSASELELKTSLYELQQAQALYDMIVDKKQQCVLYAPFNGRVTERLVNMHESVKQGQEMLSVVATDRLYARMLIPSRWLSWVDIGTVLSISVHEFGTQHNAKIIRIGGSVDEVSQSIMVIAELDDDVARLLPGMSGVASFEQQKD